MLSAQAPSPIETLVSILQGLTWPVIISAGIFLIRGISKLETKAEAAEVKFNEMHKAVTNHLVHKADEALELLRKQDQRWDAYLIANQRHGHERD